MLCIAKYLPTRVHVLNKLTKPISYTQAPLIANYMHWEAASKLLRSILPTDMANKIADNYIPPQSLLQKIIQLGPRRQTASNDHRVCVFCGEMISFAGRHPREQNFADDTMLTFDTCCGMDCFLTGQLNRISCQDAHADRIDDPYEPIYDRLEWDIFAVPDVFGKYHFAEYRMQLLTERLKRNHLSVQLRLQNAHMTHSLSM